MKRILIAFTIIVLSQLANATGTATHISPHNSEILGSIVEAARTMKMNFQNASSTTSPTDAEVYAGTLKIDIQNNTSSVPRKVVINVNGASGAGTALDLSSANRYGNALQTINGLTYPSSASSDDVGAWRNESAVSTFKTTLTNIINYCNTQLSDTSQSPYWFEFVPLHLDCQVLNNLQSAVDEMTMGTNATTFTPVIGPGVFAHAKALASADLATAAVVLDTLKFVQTNTITTPPSSAPTSPIYLKNIARCFPASAATPYVTKVLASAGITFIQDPNNATPGYYALDKVDPNRLPEPNYALGAGQNYYNNPQDLMFNNLPAGTAIAPGVQVDQNSYNHFGFDPHGVLNFIFKMRDIYRPGVTPSTCTPFCSHPYTPKDAKPEKRT